MRSEGTTLVTGESRTVCRALDRAPKDFRDYALDAAHTGVWNS